MNICETCGKDYENCVCHVKIQTTVGSIRNWQNSSDRIGMPDNQQLNEARRKITVLEQKLADLNNTITASNMQNNQLIRRINELEEKIIRSLK